MAPELKLAIGGIVPTAFSEFMELMGRVLDVGCDPQRTRPAYATSQEPITYIGLDPLLGSRQREFPFVHGMAEMLPFRGESFDSVIFSGSRDHMIDYIAGLREGTRVLRREGRINIRADLILSDQPKGKFYRLYDITRRGAWQTVRSLWRLGPRKTFTYVKIYCWSQDPARGGGLLSPLFAPIG